MLHSSTHSLFDQKRYIYFSPTLLYFLCLFCKNLHPDGSTNPPVPHRELKKKSLIGVMMHNQEFFFFGWKKSMFLTYFVGMMLIFATVTSFKCMFFHFKTPLVRPSCDCPTNHASVRSLTNTIENCTSRCGRSLKCKSATCFRSCV